MAVEHWSFLAFAQRLEAAACGLPAVVTRSIAGSSMEDERRLTPRVDVALRRGRAARAAAARRRAPARAGRGPAGKRRGRIRRCSKASWGALVAARGARSSRSSGSSTTCARGRTSSASPRTVCSPSAKCRWARTRAACSRATCRSTGTARTTSSGSRPGPRRARDDYDDVDPATGCSTSDDQRRVPRPSRRRPGRGAAGQGRSRLVARRRGRAPRPISTRHRTRWERPRSRAPGTSPDACRRARRERGARRRRRRQPRRRGSAWQPARAGCDVQLTAEIGLWGYEPTLGDPFVLNHRNFPTATMLGDAGLVLGTLVGGPGTTTDRRVSVARRSTASGTSTRRSIPGGPFLVGLGRWQRRRERRGRDDRRRDPHARQRTPPECGYVTSPGRAVRAARHGSRHAREGRRRRARAHGRAGRRRLARRTGRRGASPPAAGTSQWPATSGSCPPPTADEIAALRRWDPRGWFLRG